MSIVKENSRGAIRLLAICLNKKAGGNTPAFLNSS